MLCLLHIKYECWHSMFCLHFLSSHNVPLHKPCLLFLKDVLIFFLSCQFSNIFLLICFIHLTQTAIYTFKLVNFFCAFIISKFFLTHSLVLIIQQSVRIKGPQPRDHPASFFVTPPILSPEVRIPFIFYPKASCFSKNLRLFFFQI